MLFFLADNNNEAIWQLESINNGSNAPDGVFIIGYLDNAVPGSFAPYLLSDSLVNLFDSGDKRKENWVVSKMVDTQTYYFPYKYKLSYTGQAPQEYPVLLRLAEQYLIRAEAKAQENKVSEAIDDINVIRARAGVSPLSNTLTQVQALAAIAKERRLELFTEYGHRWLDLKRTGEINNVMNIVCPLKGGNWNSNWQVYPISLTEIQRDPNLTQNPGYQ